MKRYTLLIVGLLAAVSTGCSSDPSIRDYVRRDIVWMVSITDTRTENMDREFEGAYSELLTVLSERDKLNYRINEDIVETVREDLRVRRAQVFAEAEKILVKLDESVAHVGEQVDRCKSETSRYFDPAEPKDQETFLTVDRIEKRLPDIRKKHEAIKDAFLQYQKGRLLPPKI